MNSKLLLATAAYFKDFSTLLFATQDISSAEVSFQSYMADYGKSYPSQEEYDMRFGIFKSNLDFIESHSSDSF